MVEIDSSLKAMGAQKTDVRESVIEEDLKVVVGPWGEQIRGRFCVKKREKRTHGQNR